MKDRLQKLIDALKLTPSRFADEVGLQRATISHILNGRNNPGLDAIQRILNRFPEINATWLITGKGNMYQQQSEIATREPSLFSEKETFESNRTVWDKNEQEKGAISSLMPSQSEKYGRFVFNEMSDNKEVVRVKKIAVFYSDNTYEEFIPAEKA
jgi:transcriptional regulator with XRE-family HTH domain